ncbi:flagellar biosynthetic protein FliR [Rouxiella badensis]|nr:flagellar biosynthetic protein FliR [Rouxiella badensis]
MLSRYAPQMNAFSLALTVKSFLGFLLLIIYFHPIFSDSILPLIFTTEKLQLWK